MSGAPPTVVNSFLAVTVIITIITGRRRRFGYIYRFFIRVSIGSRKLLKKNFRLIYIYIYIVYSVPCYYDGPAEASPRLEYQTRYRFVPFLRVNRSPLQTGTSQGVLARSLRPVYSRTLVYNPGNPSKHKSPYSRRNVTGTAAVFPPIFPVRIRSAIFRDLYSYFSLNARWSWGKTSARQRLRNQTI